MILPTNDNEKPMPSKREETKRGARFVQELDLLELEGLLFCFDPKEAKRRHGKIALKDARQRKLGIEIHPHYGQPSKLAYKVELATLHKIVSQGCTLTEDGRCLYSEEVYFGPRELARLTGRVWGSAASEQLYEAVMQLRVTLVNEMLAVPDEKKWRFKNFSFFTEAEFSGTGDTLSGVLAKVNSRVIATLNDRHVAYFNFDRLNTLEPIGIALYKNICFRFAKLMSKRNGRSTLTLKKDYGAICTEWLGGLKPKRYKSDISKNQLGRYIRDLKALGLIDYHSDNPRDADDPEAVIEPNVKGDGFNLLFTA